MKNLEKIMQTLKLNSQFYKLNASNENRLIFNASKDKSYILFYTKKAR